MVGLGGYWHTQAVSDQAHQSDTRILDRRTLQRHHRRLAEMLQPGMTVLDVGCGTGAITAGIARSIGLAGRVVGLDRDSSLLATAKQRHQGIENLSFEIGDVLALPYVDEFDIVTAARAIQWVADPAMAIRQMKKAVKTGGQVVVLDYNHQDNRWEPNPPAEFAGFYSAFLHWREENGWSNSMADLLPSLFDSAGLVDVQVYRNDEIVDRTDTDFSDAAALWTHVIDSIGPNLVTAGFLKDYELLRAAEYYRDYVQTKLQRQMLCMRTVDGQKS